MIIKLDIPADLGRLCDERYGSPNTEDITEIYSGDFMATFKKNGKLFGVMVKGGEWALQEYQDKQIVFTANSKGRKEN